MSVNLTFGPGITLGQGIILGPRPSGVYLNASTFNPGDTMTWTLFHVAANTTYYVWVDGASYDGNNFTPAIVDGVTSVVTDNSGNATFTLTLNNSQPGGTFGVWFAPSLYNGGAGGYLTNSITVNAG